MMRKKRWKSEHGAELIEFALILPLLLLLCLGTIEFGRAYYNYNILTKGVRDGARYAASNRINSIGTWVTGDDIVGNTQKLVVYGKVNLTGSDVKIIPDLLQSQVNVAVDRVTDTQQYVTVSAAYPYRPLFSLIIPTTLTFRPSVKMQFIGQIVFP
jgi:Flp pilus assembly protein TadG